ncbi:hypothetical protein HDU76_002073 [Blyttiomyces sp. JEL0837]|nr:hypothetical protein HDU76_002073 [Blyttiomyces sp. JEL0837]
MVRLLLRTGGADPTVNNNEFIRRATEKDHPDVLHILLDTNRFSRCAIEAVLRIAVTKRFKRLAKMIQKNYLSISTQTE